MEGLANGSYPYFKQLFVVLKKDPAAPVAQFAAFLRSADAQAILRSHGHWPR